jgi:hypothetical protein
VESPAGYAPTLNILNQVLDNMQHLLNMIRPEQVPTPTRAETCGGICWPHFSLIHAMHFPSDS